MSRLATREMTSTVATERRARVAEMYRAGMTQWDIADELGLNQSTVSRDLTVLRTEWQQDARESYTQIKARELAQLDQVQSEAVESWHRSQLPSEEGGQPRPGNAKFLDTILACVRERAKIHGIYASEKITVTNEQCTREQLFVAAALQHDDTQELLAQLTDRLSVTALLTHEAMTSNDHGNHAEPRHLNASPGK